MDKMLVRKDNRLAKRKRVNKLKTRSLVSLLVNLSTKICSSVTLSFIYSVYKQLVNSSNLSTRPLVNHRKLNSQTENQKDTNSLQINALLACKRCSLRPLLTPFWSPIKHLLFCCFITGWFPLGYKSISYSCFCPYL